MKPDEEEEIIRLPEQVEDTVDIDTFLNHIVKILNDRYYQSTKESCSETGFITKPSKYIKADDVIDELIEAYDL